MGSVFQRRPVLVVTVTSKCYTYILFFFFFPARLTIAVNMWYVKKVAKMPLYSRSE